MQSAASVAAGYNAVNSGNYIVANLSFNPSTAFHEYRIDFVPGQVVFYADGQVLGTMNSSAIPTSPGHLILEQWSNGNPLWSGGPPNQDAVMTLSYVKAYFNSSSVSGQKNATARCEKNPRGSNSVCPIPDQTVAPDNSGANGNSTGRTYFFSDAQNKTTGQTVYHQSSAGIHGLETVTVLLGLLFFALGLGL
jgi:beta-glucanase (GH16 family)